jgi:hypothetical protein
MQLGPTVDESADISRQLMRDDPWTRCPALGDVKMYTARDIARLHDIARNLGGGNLAPYLTAVGILML